MQRAFSVMFISGGVAPEPQHPIIGVVVAFDLREYAADILGGAAQCGNRVIPVR